MKKTVILKFMITSLLFAYSVFATAATSNNLDNLASLPKDAQLLFIQIAKSGEIKAVKDQPDTYEITLRQVEPYTSYFTESPNRVTGLIPTKQFFKIWQEQNNGHGKQPNVAMETSDTKTGGRINQILELSKPVIDTKANTIKYQAKILTSKSSNSTPLKDTKLGYTVLFIDDFNWHGNIFGH